MNLREVAGQALMRISRIRLGGATPSIPSTVPAILPNRFLIFSLSRSGSSTLAKMLECHPQVRCAFEPFNPSTAVGRMYGRRIRNPRKLEAALSEVWKSHNGIKHVWNCNGIPFKTPKRQRLNHHVLAASKAKVIFLKRRNVLKRIVSGEMSHQSGRWRSTPRAREANLRHNFKPLDIRWMRSLMDQEFGAIASYRETLVNLQIPFIDVWYEDVYGEEAPPRGAATKIREIMSFLGLPEFDEGSWARLMSLLDPHQTKVNSKASYLRIPNIHEVERSLGSDETGWIFH